ncbi:MAG: diacylglycerol kinase [Deltaproteobacteria bacterium]|jgi:diacylglycerol kinase (ATP)
MTEKRNDILRLYRALIYSLQGIRAVFAREQAFRQEVLLALFLIPVGLIFGETMTSKALLIGSVFGVLIVEIINSAIEAVVDRIGSEHHELSGIAKDLGSAAVFLALVNMLAIWLILFWERLF